MKRGQPKRDSRDAVAKCEEEGRCRVCGIERGLDLAHLAPREHDEPKPGRKTRYVEPDNAIPLCRHDHTDFDAHRLDVLPYLTLDEQLHVVKTLGGIESARRRLAPTDYHRRIERARRDALLEAA